MDRETTTWGHKEKTAIYKPRRETFKETNATNTLISEFWPLEWWENVLVLRNPPVVSSLLTLSQSLHPPHQHRSWHGRFSSMEIVLIQWTLSLFLHFWMTLMPLPTPSPFGSLLVLCLAPSCLFWLIIFSPYSVICSPTPFFLQPNLPNSHSCHVMCWHKSWVLMFPLNSQNILGR